MSHNFLARTHHIRSFKKLAILGASADKNAVFVLFKFGKPGIFYCQGTKKGVSEWAKTLKQQNYMGYVLCSAVNEVIYDSESAPITSTDKREDGEHGGRTERTDTTAQFARHMEERGVREWWRVKMGFTGELKEDGME